MYKRILLEIKINGPPLVFTVVLTFISAQLMLRSVGWPSMLLMLFLVSLYSYVTIIGLTQEKGDTRRHIVLSILTLWIYNTVAFARVYSYKELSWFIVNLFVNNSFLSLILIGMDIAIMVVTTPRYRKKFLRLMRALKIGG